MEVKYFRMQVDLPASKFNVFVKVPYSATVPQCQSLVKRALDYGEVTPNYDEVTVGPPEQVGEKAYLQAWYWKKSYPAEPKADKRGLSKWFKRFIHYTDSCGDFFELRDEHKGSKERNELALTLRSVRKSRSMQEAAAHCRVYFYSFYADTCIDCGFHYIKEFEAEIQGFFRV